MFFFKIPISSHHLLYTFNLDVEYLPPYESLVWGIKKAVLKL